jgi:hypothetical protein
VSVNDDEDSFTPPDWATDDQVDLPVSYMAFGRGAHIEHRLYLGRDRIGDSRAVVKLASHPKDLETEELVILAAGAWRTCVRADCDRDMAELIVKGWLACVGSTLN